MRMGMIRRQNKALTSVLAMTICAEAESRWHLPVGDDAREELEDMVVFMLAALGASARRGGATDITGRTPHFLG